MATNHTLKTSQAQLVVSDTGIIRSLCHLTHGEILSCSHNPLWEITLQEPSTPDVLGAKIRVTSLDSPQPQLRITPESIAIEHSHIGSSDRKYAVSVTTAITIVDDCFQMVISVTNHENALIVREVSGSILNGFIKDGVQLLWPNEAGQRLDPNVDISAARITYPKEASMQFFALDAGQHGLYIASHDNSFQTTYLNAYKQPSSGVFEFSISKIPYVLPGENWISAPFILKPYSGTWHRAARTYRSWAKTWWTPPPQTANSLKLSGWQLVIMKQQNGQIIWNYHDISKLVSVGKALGLNAIGLYGWTRGGHDRNYPQYEPDPAMGGEEVLKQEIRKARESGISVILYTNGQLMDCLSPYYWEKGRHHTCLSERGEPFLEMWQKYHNAPARVHALACQSTEAWSDMLLNLAKQVHSLGASGILYDQIGSPRWPLCFSTDHKHVKPAEATGPGVIANLKRIRETMANMDPEFMILTEHVCDCINMHVHWTHGSGAGFSPARQAFPSLFRYTFPEYILTQRHKTPVLDPDSANFAVVHGFKPEVEYRYQPDRAFVEKHVRPSYKDYQEVVENEGIRMMQDVDQEASAHHLSTIMSFVQQHGDWLNIEGFCDTELLASLNDNLKAGCFLSQDKLGVLLWNPSTLPHDPYLVPSLAVELAEVYSPSGASSNHHDPIPPNSIRLYCFKLSK